MDNGKKEIVAKETPDYNPSWDLETGLADEYEFKIEDGMFAYDATYNEGQSIRLELSGTKTIDGNTSPEVLKMTIGDGWEIKDKGARVVREDGNTKKTFTHKCGLGLFIDGVRSTEAFSILKDKDVRSADIWKGLSFRLERKEVDYGGDIGKKDRMIPVEFLGSGAKKTSAKSDESGSDSGAKLSPKAKKAIRGVAESVASSGGDHDKFVEEAFALDEVNGDQAAESAVMDSGDGSIWADAVAENE